MVDFSGWDMPLLYDGILPEHRAVREAVGLFDVSHMGRFAVRGSGAEAFLDHMVTNRIAGIPDGQAVYSALCYENGGTVDDLIVYRAGPGDYLMVVNASNAEKDFAWLREHRPPGVELENISGRTALIAVQGPRAPELVGRAAGARVDDIGYYRFRRGRIFGRDAVIARLGYTGEDGYELMVDAQEAEAVWRGLLKGGSDLGVHPAGLGARDTLRFEAGLCLYGHELTAEIGPLEAGIAFAVKLEKPFVGVEALRRQREAGVPRRVVGLRMDGQRIARQGSAVFSAGKSIGEVTSGMFAPTLDGAYALALVAAGTVAVGDPVEVTIRDQKFPAHVVAKPFYRRERPGAK
jgi:aminomethyltransferase